MITAIVVSFIVGIVGGSTYLSFSDSEKFSKLYLYVHFLNAAVFACLFVWNGAVDVSIETLNMQRDWEAEYNAGLLNPLKVSAPWFWLLPVGFFFYLLFLHHLSKSFKVRAKK
jgi:hypothetical protein